MLDIDKLKTFSTDEEFANEGFSCVGMLCDVPGYEDEYERNWLLVNAYGEGIIINDEGNGYSHFVRVFDGPLKQKHKFNPRHINQDGVHFLWFKWFNGNDYCIAWEIGGPIWWKPKKIKEKHITHIGWLIFAVGFGRQPKNGENN